MADIDKGLPNTRTEIEIPSEEELQEVSVQEETPEKGPIEVIPEEDGGATIDFEPGSINIPGTETLNRYVAAKTPSITDYMDMPTALPALSEELQRIDTEADAYLQTLRGERAAEFERKSNLPRPGIDPFQAAGGGIAKLAGDPSGAMLESMNPDSQGLRSLKKRVKTI